MRIDRVDVQKPIYRFEGRVRALQASATGQVASRSLMSSEEFGFGGSTFGRAYDSSELSGDSGMAGLLELRYNAVPNIANYAHFTPYAFYDAGKVWNMNSGQDTNVSASSAGFGTYVAAVHGISGNLFLGR